MKNVISKLKFVVWAAVALGFAGGAWAKTVEVTTFAKLKEAIKDTSVDVINVAADIEVPCASSDEYMSTTAALQVKRNLTIQGKDAVQYTLRRTGSTDATGNGSYLNRSILEIYGNGTYDGVTVTLRNIIFDGGAVWASGSTPQTRFENRVDHPSYKSTAGNYYGKSSQNSGVAGHSVIDVAKKATLNLEGGAVVQNGECTNNARTGTPLDTDNKTNVYGGGIRVECYNTTGGGTINVKSGAIVQDCVANKYGGGIGAYNLARINVYGGTIRRCSARIGGGIGVTWADEAYGSTSSKTHSGVISTSGGLLEDCWAQQKGGALAIEGTAKDCEGDDYYKYSRILNLTAKNCVATDGAALAVFDGANTTVYLTKSPAVTATDCTGPGNYTGLDYTTSSCIYKDSESSFVEITSIHTLSFVDGADLYGQVEVEHGRTAGPMFPADPARTGMVFTEWRTNLLDSASKIDKDTKINSDVTAYAYWVSVQVKLDSATVPNTTYQVFLKDSPITPDSTGKYYVPSNEQNIVVVYTANANYYFAGDTTAATNQVITSTNPATVQTPLPEASQHKHCICGTGTCVVGEHSHSDLVWTGWTSTTSLPTTAGNWFLLNDVTLTAEYKPVTGVNLCLNGHTVTQTASEKRVINVFNSGSSELVFSLTDCAQIGKITGGTITGGQNYGAGVNVKKTSSGKSIFNYYGGIICGNTATSVADVGSGCGGGVCVDNACEFYMYGGAISNNTATSIDNYSGTGRGGGLFVSDTGKAFVYGGDICYNTANRYGGGVEIGSDGTKTPTMTFGGTARVFGNTGGCAGGICCDSGSLLTVIGGEIFGNNANKGKLTNGDAGKGGGLYLYDGPHSISHCVIYNNSASVHGGGVCHEAGQTVTFGGALVVTNNTVGGTLENVYFSSGKTVAISSLASDSKIGVTLQTPPASKGAKTAFTTNGADADRAYFVSDDAKYNVVYDSDHLALEYPLPYIEVKEPSPLPANTTFDVYTNGVKVAKTDGKYMVVSNSTDVTVVYTAEDSYYFADGTTAKTNELTAAQTGTDPATLPTAPAAPKQHKHCICGTGTCSVGGHSHDDIVWKAWTSTNALPTSAGDWFLVNDVTLTVSYFPVDGVNLCLNGKSITQTVADNSVIGVTADRTFTLTDCSGNKGIVTSGGLNCGVDKAGVNNNGTFNFYAGTITNIVAQHNSGGVRNTATMTMYGGRITGCSCLKGGDDNRARGGGIYNDHVLYMKGGEIDHCTTAWIGGGVANLFEKAEMYMTGGVLHDNNQAGVYAGKTLVVTGGTFTNNAVAGIFVRDIPEQTWYTGLTVGGDVKMSGNGDSGIFFMCGSAGISGAVPLASGVKIGINAGDAPQPWTPIVVVTNAVQADLGKFELVSDSAAYELVYEDTQLLIRMPNVEVQDPGIANTTFSVLTNGAPVELTGGKYLVPSNAPNVKVVYTAEDGYYFADGTTAKTNDVTTSVNPATHATPEAPRGPVQYLAPVYVTDGDPTSGVDHWVTNTVYGANVVTSSTEAVEWNGESAPIWYVATNDVTIVGGVACLGDVNLILCDGAKLTVEVVDEVAGIATDRDGSFTVYAQEKGTGELEVTGGERSAAIGGSKEDVGYSSKSGDNITLNGGIVTAFGGRWAAAIGGSYGGNGVNIVINGGTVKALAGELAAAIGGGQGNETEGLVINGGTIAVLGNSDSDLIGRGKQGHDATDVLIAPTANILFSACGETDPLPTDFEGFVVMTPMTQSVDRVLVTGFDDSTTWNTFALTNLETGAAKTIAVDTRPTYFAARFLSITNDASKIVLKSVEAVEVIPEEVTNTTYKVYWGDEEVSGPPFYVPKDASPVTIVYEADPGYMFPDGSTTKTNELEKTATGNNPASPLPPAPPAPVIPVATVTTNAVTTYYGDINDAWTNAVVGTAGNPATLTLLADIALTNQLETVKDGVYLKFDFNDHVLSSSIALAGTTTLYNKMIYFSSSSGKLEIVDQAAEKTKKYFTKTTSGLWAITNEATALFVKGGVITGSKENSAVWLSQGDIEIRDVSFVGNHTLGAGAALYVACESVNIYNTRFYGNVAEKSGGAIDGTLEGKFLMKDCDVRYNVSGASGGGIYMQNKCVLIGTTVSDNIATNNGAGIYFQRQTSCLAAGTMILMADGTERAIEEIAEGDLVATFDHEGGTNASARTYLAYEGPSKARPFTLAFDNGTTLSIVGVHDILEESSRKYVQIAEVNASSFVGKRFYGRDGAWHALTGVTFGTESVAYYSIYSAQHQNVYANGLLTVPDDADYILNLYELDAELKADPVQLANDIATYGLVDPIVAAEKYGMSRQWFDDNSVKYIYIAIGKGLTTLDKEVSDFKANDSASAPKKQVLMSAPKLTAGPLLASGSDPTLAGFDDYGDGVLVLGANAVVTNNFVGAITNSNVHLASARSWIALANDHTGVLAGVTRFKAPGEITTTNELTTAADVVCLPSDDPAYVTRFSTNKYLRLALLSTVTPDPVEHTTFTIYTNGVPIVEQSITLPDDIPVEVVYTPDDGYKFEDGSDSKTNAFNTTVNPATLIGDLPHAGAFAITNQTTLTEAINLLSNNCNEAWYIADSFNLSASNVIDFANSSLKIFGADHTISATNGQISAFELVGTNGALAVTFDTTSKLTLVDKRAPETIATDPLIVSNGVVSATGLTEMGLGYIELLNGKGWSYLVEFTPTNVEHTTHKVFAADYEIPGEPYMVPSNGAPVYVVYKADEGYKFEDGSEEQTNKLNTTTNPAQMEGDLPNSAAFAITNQTTLTEAINLLSNNCNEAWYIADSFNLATTNVIDFANASLKIFGAGHTISATNGQISAFSLVGTNGALSVAFDTTSKLTLVDKRAPETIATDPLIVTNGAVTATGLTEMGLGYIELKNGKGWSYLVEFTPTNVEHTTHKVYAAGYEIPGEPYMVPSNGAPVYVVYKTNDGYKFEDGSEEKTNKLETTTNPAQMEGDLPNAGAFAITNQTTLTEAINLLSNNCNEAWYIADSFNLAASNVIDFANASLKIFGAGHTISATNGQISAFELVGTNGALSVTFDTTSKLTLVDKRAPETIATDPLIVTNGAVTATGLMEMGLGYIELLNGKGWSYLVSFTPEEVEHTTFKVYSAGYEIPGPSPYLVPSNGAPVEVVYTPEDGYTFPDGTTAKTNKVDTSKNPAELIGDLPSAGAFIITNQTTLTQAILALTNAANTACKGDWYIGADFTATENNYVTAKNGLDLRIRGNGHTITGAHDDDALYNMFYFKSSSTNDAELLVEDLNLVVSNGFRYAFNLQTTKKTSKGVKFKALQVTFDDVDVVMAHSAAMWNGSEFKTGAAIENNYAALALTNGCSFTANTNCWAAIDLTSTNGWNAALTILSDDITFVDNRTPETIAIEPLVKYTNEAGGVTAATGMEKTSLKYVELQGGVGYSYVVPLTPTTVEHTTNRVYAAGYEIPGVPHWVPSNGVPVEVVYTPLDGYTFSDGTTEKTNKVDTSKSPAEVIGDLPSAGAFAIINQTTLTQAINLLSNNCNEAWYIADSFNLSASNVIDFANASLKVFGAGHTISATNGQISAFELVGTNGALSVAFDTTSKLTLTDTRDALTIATDPLIVTNGAVTVTGLTEMGLGYIELKNGKGWSYLVEFTPTNVEHTTHKVYAAGYEIPGEPYMVPSNGAPVYVVYKTNDGYKFDDGSEEKTNKLETTTNPAQMEGDLPNSAAFAITNQTTLTEAINLLSNNCNEAWYIADDFNLSVSNVIDFANASLKIFGAGHTISATNGQISAFELVGTNGALTVAFDTTSKLTLTDTRAPETIATDPLIVTNGAVTATGLTEMGLGYIELLNGKGWSYLVSFTPEEVEGTTYKVYAAGKEIPGTPYWVPSNGAPVYAVYTPDDDDSFFEDGTQSVTNYYDTSKQPAENKDQVPQKPVRHEHCLCVDACTIHGHTCVTNVWRGWSRTDSLPTEAGYWYLAKDVMLTSEQTIAADVKICLNGKKVTQTGTGKSAVIVSANQHLAFTDCSTDEAGAIASVDGGLAVTNEGMFELYAGTITNGTAMAEAAVKNAGDLYLYGGAIRGNACTGIHSTSNVVMIGGLVAENAKKGIITEGTLKLGGDVWVADNGEANVYVATGKTIELSTDEPLKDALIGVTMASETGTFVTSGATIDNRDFFFSDQDALYVKLDGETLALARRGLTIDSVTQISLTNSVIAVTATGGVTSVWFEPTYAKIMTTLAASNDVSGWSWSFDRGVTGTVTNMPAAAQAWYDALRVVINGKNEEERTAALQSAVQYLVVGKLEKWNIASLTATPTYKNWTPAVGDTVILMECPYNVVDIESDVVNGYDGNCSLREVVETYSAAWDNASNIVMDVTGARISLGSLFLHNGHKVSALAGGSFNIDNHVVNYYPFGVGAEATVTIDCAFGVSDFFTLGTNAIVKMGANFSIINDIVVRTEEDLLVKGIIKVFEPAEGVTFTAEKLEEIRAHVFAEDYVTQGFTTIVIDNAIYLAARFTISYDAQDGKWADGTVVSNLLNYVSDGYLVPAEPPTREKYGFAGWYTSWTNGAAYVDNGTNLTVYADHSIYAKWISQSSDPGDEVLDSKDSGTETTTVLGAKTNETGAVSEPFAQGELALPDRIGNDLDSKFITAIAREAFAKQNYDDKVAAEGDKLRSVRLSSYLTRVGDAAFYACKYLTNITFAATRDYRTNQRTTVRLGSRAFAGSAITTLVIPVGTKVYLGANCFAQCPNLTKIFVYGQIAGIDNAPFSKIGGGQEVTVHLSPEYAADKDFVARLTKDMSTANVKIDSEPLGQASIADIVILLESDISVLFTVQIDSPWGAVNENTVALFYTEDLAKGFTGTGNVLYPVAPVTQDPSTGYYTAKFYKEGAPFGMQFYRLTVGAERK